MDSANSGMRGVDVPTRMSAAWIDQLGTAERLRFGELPAPTPGSSEVLVRVAAEYAAVPADRLYRLPDGSPRVVEVLPLSAAAEAHRRLETGRAHDARLVLRVDHAARQIAPRCWSGH